MDGAGSVFGARTHRFEIDMAADDQTDHLGLRHRGRLEHAGDAPVAQNRRPVGDLQHLVDVVRDEDDACAVGDDLANRA